MSDKYVQYMENVGGRISIGAFNDDWEPVGGILLDNLLNNGDVVIEDLYVVLVDREHSLVKQKKNFPNNGHMDHYTSDGWVYLGSNKECDFYVNHTNKWTSIVFSNEDCDYASSCYRTLMSGDEKNMIMGTYKEYPYSLLKELISKELEKE